MNGSDQLLSIMDVLKNNFEYMQQNGRTTGRTTKMIDRLVAYVIINKFPIQRILVFGSSTPQCKYLYGAIINAFFKRGIKTVTSIHSQPMSIAVRGTHIEVDIFDNFHRYARIDPNPLRYVDHHVGETVIAEGLEKIKNKLKLLKTGE